MLLILPKDRKMATYTALATMLDYSERNLGSVQDFLHGGTQLNCC